MNEQELNKEKERLIQKLIEEDVLKTPKIIEAFRKFSRHEFITKEYAGAAYFDVALQTLKDSTISQPFTVAIMTEALDPQEGEKILEIGTGSAWQSCLIAYCLEKNGKVISLEIDKDLAEFGKKNIGKFGLKNIKIINKDGSLGYESEAPYDKVIITCGTQEVPQPIKDQLKIGGIIVVPMGVPDEQKMFVMKKIGKDKFESKNIYSGSFAFVQLKGKYGLK
jgi:protein-L-isoaspartate(D-aspartate) O-methyltransferase